MYKFIVAAFLGLAALTAPTVAEARVDVGISIGVPLFGFGHFGHYRGPHRYYGPRIGYLGFYEPRYYRPRYYRPYYPRYYGPPRGYRDDYRYRDERRYRDDRDGDRYRDEGRYRNDGEYREDDWDRGSDRN